MQTYKRHLAQDFRRKYRSIVTFQLMADEARNKQERKTLEEYTEDMALTLRYGFTS